MPLIFYSQSLSDFVNQKNLWGYRKTPGENGEIPLILSTGISLHILYSSC